MPPSMAAAQATDAYRNRLTVVRDAAASVVGGSLASVDLDQPPVRLGAALRDWQQASAEIVAGSRMSAAESTEAYLAAYLATVSLEVPALPALEPVDVNRRLVGARKALLYLLGRGDGREAAVRYGRYVAERNTRTVIGDAAREVLTAGIRTSPHIVGWRRVTSTSTCQRCSVLTTRVYHDREPFQRHPGCRCTAEPVLRGLPELVVRDAARVVAA